MPNCHYYYLCQDKHINNDGHYRNIVHIMSVFQAHGIAHGFESQNFKPNDYIYYLKNGLFILAVYCPCTAVGLGYRTY